MSVLRKNCTEEIASVESVCKYRKHGRKQVIWLCKVIWQEVLFIMPLVIVIVTMYSLVTLDHYDGTKEGLFDG